MQIDDSHVNEEKEGGPDTAARPHLRSVGIVGLGVVGSSIGLDLVKGGTDCAGFDINPEHLRRALARGAVNRTVARLSDLAGCEAVLICVPPSRVAEVAKTLRRVSDATLIDVASCKSYLARTALQDPKFIPSHPMRGSNLSGPDAARDGLFEGGTWVITPVAGTSNESLQFAERLIRSTGATPVYMDAWTHDRVCARISHLPHVISSALVLTAFSQEPTEAHLLAGASFKDQTRVARGNPNLWRDTAMTNKEAIVQGLSELILRLGGFLQDLKDGDTAAVGAFFCTASDLLDTPTGEQL